MWWIKIRHDAINSKPEEDNLFIIKIKKELLKGYVNIIEIFNTEKTEFYYDLNDLEKSLCKDNIINNINNIRESLEKLDTNVVNNINLFCIYISFIITLYKTKNFLPFLISKKEKIEELNM